MRKEFSRWKYVVQSLVLVLEYQEEKKKKKAWILFGDKCLLSGMNLKWRCFYQGVYIFLFVPIEVVGKCDSLLR